MLMTCPKCGQLVSGQTGDQCLRCKIFLQPASKVEQSQQRQNRLEEDKKETPVTKSAKPVSVPRKKKKRSIIPYFLLLLVVAAASFTLGLAIGDGWFEETVVSDISLDESGIKLEVGEKEKLSYTITQKWATDQDVSWESSDPLIASVNARGLVTARKSGVCVITASVAGKSDTVLISVRGYDSDSFSNKSEDRPDNSSSSTKTNTDSYSSYTPSYSGSKEVSDDYKLALFTLAEEKVKEQLKSPSSAKFPKNYLGSDVQYERNGDRYTIASWVEAQNSYGAMIREQFMLSTTISGGKMKDIVCIIG